jgi:hypothetical protein
MACHIKPHPWAKGNRPLYMRDVRQGIEDDRRNAPLFRLREEYAHAERARAPDRRREPCANASDLWGEVSRMR